MRTLSYVAALWCICGVLSSQDTGVIDLDSSQPFKSRLVSGNAYFTDSTVFRGYCQGFLPNAVCLGVKESDELWIAFFWDASCRGLYLLDVPKFQKTYLWDRRPYNTAKFYDLAGAKRSPITRRGINKETVPLMNQVEIRTSTSDSVYGVPLGGGYLIPDGIVSVGVEYDEGRLPGHPTFVELSLNTCQAEPTPAETSFWLSPFFAGCAVGTILCWAFYFVIRRRDFEVLPKSNNI